MVLSMGQGGPASVQHEWMKLRLMRIATELGYTATPEHAPTNVDLFFHAPAFGLDVIVKYNSCRPNSANVPLHVKVRARKSAG
jgi:hypothetical protein